MRRTLFAALAFGILAAAPAIAEAAEGFATANVNMRSGPSTAYPAVTTIPVGEPLDINGCLADVAWCDVSFAGGRGWVSGQYIQATYQSRRIYIDRQYYRPLGIPTVVFNLDDYWGRYYRSRDFYRERDRWRRGPGWVDRRPGWDRGPDRDNRPDRSWDRRPDRRDWSDNGDDNRNWDRRRDGDNQGGDNRDWGRQRPDRNDGDRNDTWRRRPEQDQDNRAQQPRPQRDNNQGAGSAARPYSPNQVDPVPCNPGETCLRPSVRGSNR